MKLEIEYDYRLYVLSRLRDPKGALNGDKQRTVVVSLEARDVLT